MCCAQPYFIHGRDCVEGRKSPAERLPPYNYGPRLLEKAIGRFGRKQIRKCVLGNSDSGVPL